MVVAAVMAVPREPPYLGQATSRFGGFVSRDTNVLRFASEGKAKRTKKHEVLPKSNVRKKNYLLFCVRIRPLVQNISIEM